MLGPSMPIKVLPAAQTKISQNKEDYCSCIPSRPIFWVNHEFIDNALLLGIFSSCTSVHCHDLFSEVAFLRIFRLACSIFIIQKVLLAYLMTMRLCILMFD